MSDTQAAYLAGILDGEGTIVISFRDPKKASREINTQLTIQIVVVMTHEATIREIARMTGTENKVYFSERRKSYHKDTWAWRPGLKEARKIIAKCEPYMITKKRNAQIFMELLDIRQRSTRSERNWQSQYNLAIENQSINKRGALQFQSTNMDVLDA